MEIECARLFEPEGKVLERYSTVIDKLWRAAGVRILLETAGRLMSGETVQIGEANISKKGMWLGKRSWFKSEPYFAGWEELTKVTDSGQLRIGSTREPKASVALSLRDADNAVVLERLLGVLWKDELRKAGSGDALSGVIRVRYCRGSRVGPAQRRRTV
jgi:hypothetical protein